MQIKNSVEQKIKSVADKMPSFTYVYEDWTRADVRLERLSLPAIINLLPVSGSLSLKKDQFRDAPNCMLVFVDKVQRDANGSDNEEVFERMKFAAMEFVTRLNQSGLFDPIEGDIPYSVILERLSPVLTGISVSFKLKEVTGVCTSKVLR
ncbi:hypothetical protein [uncultured Bacteroides sp.]|uniref:hypothetical protein n=1 Tax=uncultured Bacteroides sp. TaxID=162156 RepID=UPI002AABB2B1|nr:hypothetical protein [uncultured Bacteroides sp.]